MRVWKVLNKKEEQVHLKKREISPCSNIMPVREKIIINNEEIYVHHIDDQDGQENDTTLHPLFIPGNKPSFENWKYDYNHEYDKCKCHLELRKYGQDESIYYSSETSSSC